jgi:hypothetical protein
MEAFKVKWRHGFSPGLLLRYAFWCLKLCTLSSLHIAEWLQHSERRVYLGIGFQRGTASQYSDNATGWTTGARFPAGATMGLCILDTGCRLALKPNQPPNQWIPGALTPGAERPDRESVHSPPLVPRLIMRRAIPSLLHTSSWRGA